MSHGDFKHRLGPFVRRVSLGADVLRGNHSGAPEERAIKQRPLKSVSLKLGKGDGSRDLGAVGWGQAGHGLERPYLTVVLGTHFPHF